MLEMILEDPINRHGGRARGRLRSHPFRRPFAWRVWRGAGGT
jgi:hypothetical protein